MYRRPTAGASGTLRPSSLYWPPHDVDDRGHPGGERPLSEFNWWLLIVGLVVGAGLVWLVLADASRRDQEVTDRELPLEAAWIESELSSAGRPVAPGTAEEVLRLHRTYLASLPPDNAFADDEVDEPAARIRDGREPVARPEEAAIRRPVVEEMAHPEERG